MILQRFFNATRKFSGWLLVAVLPIWVFVSFVVASIFIYCLVWLFGKANISIASFDESVVSAVLSALLYVFMLAMLIGLPWLIKKWRVSQDELGLTRLPSWTDILITPFGLIVYVVLSAVLMLLMSSVFPDIDMKQVQDTGFSQLHSRYEYLLAFLTLVVIAPVAEEIIFRGYLFGKLKKFAPIWLAILVTSVLFGVIHGAWNLAIDTFALSVILCLLRLSTGSLWASILLHMTKNGIAFYILFINPTIFTTLVR